MPRDYYSVAHTGDAASLRRELNRILDSISRRLGPLSQDGENISVGAKKFTSLAAGTNNSDAIRLDQTFLLDDLASRLLGTTNEITIVDNGDETLTFSLPNQIKLDGATASRLLATDGSKLTTSVASLTSWIAGTINKLTVTDDLDGTVTLDVTADYTQISSNDAATDVTGAELETLTDTSNADALHVHTGASLSSIDHGTDLTAASLLDDDHTQYFLLAGRAGGQTGYGDTAASGNLILSSTAHATKGKVFIGNCFMFDESTCQLGIGTTTVAAGYDVQIQTAAGSSPSILFVDGDMTFDWTGIPGAPIVGSVGDLNVTSGTKGGLNFRGFSDALSSSAATLQFTAYQGSASPTWPAIYFAGWKTNGATGRTALVNDEIIASFNTGTTSKVVVSAYGRIGVNSNPPGAGIDVVSNSATTVTGILKGYASQTAESFQIKDSAGNIVHSFALATATQPYVVINRQTGDIDLIVRGTTAQNLIRTDAANNRVGINELTPDATLEVNGTFNTGDGTNQAKFAADGELTLAGTARVNKEFELNARNFAPGASGATEVLVGNHDGWSFGIGDDIVSDFEIPHDWDSSTDLTLVIYWAINEDYATNSGEVQWQIDWSATPANATESIAAPTHSDTIDYGDQNIPATAYYLTKSGNGTIPAASLTVGDLIGITVTRVALDAGSDPTAEPIIFHIEVHYISNKLGEAT